MVKKNIEEEQEKWKNPKFKLNVAVAPMLKRARLNLKVAVVDGSN